MKEIFDELVHNAPSYLKGVELTEDDARYAEKLMREENLSLKEACEIVYEGIAEVLGI